MPARVEDESEILLGNKQLLLVFALVAVLLAVAFGAGYMLGKSSGDKKNAESAQVAAPPADASGGPITQKITPDDAQPVKADAPPVMETPAPVEVTPEKPEKILGAPSVSSGMPRHGENYVQVEAVVRKVADATVDVLRQHGFAARVAPAPGNGGIFRVLVGPAKDAGDLRSTEDRLRKIGYTKCFVQHY